MRLTQAISVLLVALISSCNGQHASNTASESASGSVNPSESKILLGESIQVIFQDSDLNYWFAGRDDGPVRWDGENLEEFSRADGLVSHSITAIREDRGGQLFFETTEGVSVFNGKDFHTLEVVEGGEWKLEEDDLWFRIGWGGNGPYRFDGEKLNALEFPKPAMADTFYARYPNVGFSPYGVYTIYTDRSNHLWFGTSSLGLCRFDGDSIHWLYEEHLTSTPQGGAFGIRSILEDKEGDFWICNPTFRYRMNPGSTLNQDTPMIQYERLDGIRANDEHPYFMSMTQDQQGDLWMATYDHGVYRKQGEELMRYPVGASADSVQVFSIYCDRNNTVWLGTHNNGAMRFDGKEFSRFVP